MGIGRDIRLPHAASAIGLSPRICSPRRNLFTGHVEETDISDSGL